MFLYRRDSNKLGKVHNLCRGGRGGGCVDFYRVANEFFLFNFREVLSKIPPLVKEDMIGGKGSSKTDLINQPPSIYSYLGEGSVRDI